MNFRCMLLRTSVHRCTNSISDARVHWFTLAPPVIVKESERISGKERLNSWSTNRDHGINQHAELGSIW